MVHNALLRRHLQGCGGVDVGAKVVTAQIEGSQGAAQSIRARDNRVDDVTNRTVAW